MNNCKKCGEPAYMPFTCSRCGGTFCQDHRISHDCISVTAVDAGKITEKEIVNMAIRSRLRETIDAVDVLRNVVGEEIDYVKRKVVKGYVSALRGNRACIILPCFLFVLGVFAILANHPAGILLAPVSAAAVVIISRAYRGMKPSRDISDAILNGQMAAWAGTLHRLWVTRAVADIAVHVAWIAYTIIMLDWLGMVFVTLSTIISVTNVKSLARRERLLERACKTFEL